MTDPAPIDQSRVGLREWSLLVAMGLTTGLISLDETAIGVAVASALVLATGADWAVFAVTGALLLGPMLVGRALRRAPN